MSAVAVTEAEFRAGVTEMFKALDLDQNNELDWDECKYLVSQVMKQDGGYNSESFKAKYDAMDKNDDDKISKQELMEAVVQVGKERNLFGPSSKPVAVSSGRATAGGFSVQEDPNEEAVSTQIFREGLSCLGKTFNNARHAYLKLNICDKSLTTIKVSDFLYLLIELGCLILRAVALFTTSSFVIFFLAHLSFL